MDDLIFIINYQPMFEDFKEVMTQQCEIIELGLMSYFLRIEVQQMNDGIFISKKKYIIDIVKLCKMKSSSSIICTPIMERLEMKKKSTR